MTNTEKLHAAFAEGLGIDIGRVSAELAYETIPEWDSIGHMALVVALEGSFDVMLDTEQIIGLSSLARAQDILAGHGVAF